MTADGPRHSRRDSRPSNAGYIAAASVLVVAGAGLITLGIVAGISNGLTDREWIAGFIAFAAAIVAALWLRRESRQHGGRGRQ
jgi:high-affinity Fe2+/Pb2+ permease